MNASVRTLIVVLNWNGWKDTLECLDSLLDLKHDSFAVVVVDNASTDESISKIIKWGEDRKSQGLALDDFVVVNEPLLESFDYRTVSKKSIFLIKALENGGFAKGNNIGLRFGIAAGADYLWLLNNDTVVDPGSLHAMEKMAESNKKIGLVGSVLTYYDEREVIQAYGGVSFNKWLARGHQLGQGMFWREYIDKEGISAPFDYLAGASILIKSDFIRDVGFMTEDYFLYFEEIDWVYRSRERWEMAISAESFVFHKEGGAIGTNSRASRSLLSQYYLNRNLILFYRRYLPLLTIISIVRVLREAFGCLVRGELQLALISAKSLLHGVSGVSGRYERL